MNLIDHIEIPVATGKLAKEFYTATLGVLGMSVVIDIPPERNKHKGTRCGFGVNNYPYFWIHDNDNAQAPIHIAFKTDSHQQVDAAYALALKHGGTDNGPPGIRTQYHDNYYAAFVLDPDGNNVEFVCQNKS